MRTKSNTNGVLNQAFEHSNESSLIQSPVMQSVNISQEEMKYMRILWLRNIKRIQIQVKIHFLLHKFEGNQRLIDSFHLKKKS